MAGTEWMWLFLVSEETPPDPPILGIKIPVKSTSVRCRIDWTGGAPRPESDVTSTFRWDLRLADRLG